MGEGEARGLLREAVAAFLQARGSATGRDLAVIYGGADGGLRLQAVLQVIPSCPRCFSSVPCAWTVIHRTAAVFRSVSRCVQAVLQVLSGCLDAFTVCTVHSVQAAAPPPHQHRHQ